MDDQVMEAFGTLATALGHAGDVIEYPAVRALYDLLGTHKREVLREAAERIRSEAVQQYDQDSPPITYDEYRGMRRAARLIDPEVKP